MRGSYSLRTRLFWLLLAAICLTAAIQAIVAYRTALAEVDEIFDYQMQKMAHSLRPGFSMGQEAAEPSTVPSNTDFAFVVQAWTSGGISLFQSSSGVSFLPQRAALGFSNVQTSEGTYRVFSVVTRSQVIQVAQSLAARRQIAGASALRMVTPILVMVPLLMLVVWWVVSVSLAPIARVRQQVATRQIDDLHAVSELGLPDELRPVVRELNLLFKRIHDAFETQTTFVADAAHELRSPLAALKLQVEGLRRAQDEIAHDKAVVRLNAGIDRATRLVEQLLALARQQAMKTTPAKNETVDLVSAVRTVVAEMALTAQLRNIHVDISALQPCSVSGQVDALHMLVRNLLDNAIKYTPEGGQVAIASHPSAEQILLTVDDSGTGIAAQDRERVFDRFYRATGTEVSGSGLGLAIVKTIAEVHGARLTLDQSPRLGGLRVSLSFHRLTNVALNETY